MLSLDGVSELLSSLLELLLGGSSWNGVGLSLSHIGKLGACVNSGLVLYLDMNWASLANNRLGLTRAVHCVVHNAALVHILTVNEWVLVSASLGVCLMSLGLSKSVWSLALHNAASNDTQSTRILRLSVLRVQLLVRRSLNCGVLQLVLGRFYWAVLSLSGVSAHVHLTDVASILLNCRGV